jgi:formylglycine-generating enzyme required for sulfatase activity
MNKTRMIICLAVVCMMAAGSIALADTDSFGTGDNAFNIDFVPISGSTNPTSGYGIVNKDYRMGTYEITNEQWTKFKAAYGAVAGTPTTAYDSDPYFTGSSVPTNNVSWCEAAQFVNWLNTSKGYQAAYKFTGEIHTPSYTLDVWSSQDADGTNLYRNKNAKYFLPTENEWVKAAYWNGTSLQTWATIGDVSPTQGNGTSGTGWNYWDYGRPWAVGSGSLELNGTYDIMGNVWEWMESPVYTGDYLSGFNRGIRGGSYDLNDYYVGLLASSYLYDHGTPNDEYVNVGFRVASIVPEPCSLALLFFGGLTLRYRKR